jgi:hypothetical protein
MKVPEFKPLQLSTHVLDMDRRLRCLRAGSAHVSKEIRLPLASLFLKGQECYSQVRERHNVGSGA